MNARRAFWSLRSRLGRWNGTSDDAVTPAGGDRWEDVQSGMTEALAEAPAREMGVYISDAEEYELAEIVRRHRSLWRRAARRLRRRAVAS